MKRVLLSIFSVFLILVFLLYVFFHVIVSNIQKITTESSKPAPVTQTHVDSIAQFSSPISDPLSRITAKPFGIYVSPQHSPVSPEKFTGYHTGVDFETFPSEKDADVSISVICSGEILEKEQARGYGGMVVQKCSLDNQPITVVYGHLRLKSITVAPGQTLKVGDFLGYLGTGYSSETDGERKHLHLGIHKGATIDTRGYVQNKNELRSWIDFANYLK